MRIISGEHRGRRLKRVNKITTRETSDMVREAVFNILNDVKNAHVLDLYAGSGSYGLEALSRGAQEVLFVDHDKDAINCIKENVQMLSYQSQAKMILSSDDHFFKTQTKIPRFDLVFVDPPYAMNHYLEILDNLEPLVNTSGRIIIETAKKTELPEQYQAFRSRLSRPYGSKRVTLYIKETAT
jgi:16S rRNA (guanine966-N2)-methyltransferase